MTNELSERLEERLAELLEEGDELLVQLHDVVYEDAEEPDDFSLIVGPESEYSNLIRRYERWYSSTRVLINDYLNDRLSDFDRAYERFHQFLDFEDYDRRPNTHEVFYHISRPILTQIGLLESIPSRIELEMLQARKMISSKIVNDELQKAHELFSDGEVRVPGILAGVALERHLLTICENSDKDLEFGYMDGISSLARTLNSGGVITDDEMRLLDYLGGIRNKCAHANEEAPIEEEVRRLLNEVGQFIREQ